MSERRPDTACARMGFVRRLEARLKALEGLTGRVAHLESLFCKCSRLEEDGPAELIYFRCPIHPEKDIG